MSEIGQAFSDPEALYNSYNEGGGLTGLSSPSITNYSPSTQEDTPALELFSDKPYTPARESSTGVKSPSFGMMALVGLLGGPQAVNSYAERYRASQAGPIIGQLRVSIDKAIQAGDLDTAEKMMGGLGNLAQYSPQAVEEYKNFANKINSKRKDQEQVDSVLKSIDLKTLARDNFQAASDLIRFSQIGSRNLEGLKQVLGANELNITRSGQIVSSTNKLYGTYTEQTVAPNIEAKEYSPEKIAAIQQLKLDPNKIANIENRLARDEPIRPSELKAYNEAFPELTARIQKNTEMKYIPPAVGVDLNLATGRAQELTSPPSITSTPTKKPEQAKTFNKALDNEAKIVSDQAKAYADSGQGTYQEGLDKTLQKYDIQLSPEQKARFDKTLGDAREAYEKAKATETGKGEGRFQSEQSIAAKFTKDGRIITKFNIPQETIDKEGWALFNQPVEQEKIFSAYGSFKEQSRALKKQIENTPEHALTSDDSSILDKAVAGARRLFAQGVAPIAIAGHSVGVPGMGNVNLNPDEARIYNKLAILMRQAEHVYNIKEKDDPRLGDLRAMLTGKLATKDTMLRAIEDMTESIEDHVRGIIRANNPNAVEEPDRKPHMPNTNIIGIGNPLPTSLPPLPTSVGLPGTAAPSKAPSLTQSNAPIQVSPEDVLGATQIDTGVPSLPAIPLTRSTPQVGPTSPLGNSPITNSGGQVSGQATIDNPRINALPRPVRAGENIEVLQVPILGKTIQSIKKSFKERSNVK